MSNFQDLEVFESRRAGLTIQMIPKAKSHLKYDQKTMGGKTSKDLKGPWCVRISPEGEELYISYTDRTLAMDVQWHQLHKTVIVLK